MPSVTVAAQKHPCTTPAGENATTATEEINTSENSNCDEIDPSSSPQVAGLVGLATGLGALIALWALLRLPATFQQRGVITALAIRYSYYTAGLLALGISIVCFFGLRHLDGEEEKGYRRLFGSFRNRDGFLHIRNSLLLKAARLGFRHRLFGLAYLGGFAARASSVCITTFIPLLVNNCSASMGGCDADDQNPSDIKRQCHDVFVVSSQLTGISQTAGLVGALPFGFFARKSPYPSMPLAIAAVLGITSFGLTGSQKCSSIVSGRANAWLMVIVSLSGLSQVGMIVCSLGLLGQCIIGEFQERKAKPSPDPGVTHEAMPLVPGSSAPSYKEWKGSIAGTSRSAILKVLLVLYYTGTCSSSHSNCILIRSLSVKINDALVEWLLFERLIADQ